MSEFYCVRIRDDDYSCTKLKQTSKNIVFKEHLIFDDLESLKNFIKNKNNINFLLFENHFLKSSISLSRNISDRSSINSMIFSKLQKEYSNIDAIRFKYSVAEDNPKKDNIKYSINGLYQDSKSYTTFNQLKTYENSNLISLENYSLYQFCKMRLPTHSFISVYVDIKNMVIVAGDKDELYYSRNEVISPSSSSIAQEIVKNVLFAKQRVRDVKFNALILNGTVFEDESIYQTVYEQINIPVSSFMFDTKMYQNFTPKVFNETLLDIGSLDMPYEFDFTSGFIKSHIQFNKTLKLYIPLMFILLVYFGVESYSKFGEYSKLNQEYQSQLHSISDRSKDLVIKYNQKDTLYGFVDTLKTANNNDILNQISNIKDSLELVNNSNIGIVIKADLTNFSWEDKEISQLSFSRQKQFVNLNELNRFKNKLNGLSLKLKKNAKVSASYDLNNLSSDINFIFYGVGK